MIIDWGKYLGSHSPGYVVEILHGDKCEEYVVGDSEVIPVRKACDAETLYDIASLTKVYTAVLVYMAYEEERIDIEDYVSNVDDRFVGLRGVRILDLLGHNQEVWTEGYLGDAKSEDEFYKILFSAKVINDVPTYVDVHYIILSAILERVYGAKFEEILERKIFRTLGLVKTTVNPMEENIASCSYSMLGNGFVDNVELGSVHDMKARVAKGLGIVTGHASIFTTGGELMGFLRGILDNKLLRPETVKKMLEHGDEKWNYNNMGVRYRSMNSALNDVPAKCSENTVVFSGYTGPAFLIDFDKDMIIVLMCNVLHYTKLGRAERKRLTDDIMSEIYEQVSLES